MSPSQAMSNHSAPSVRLHPPGLVFSLLASVPCHGLAPTLAYQALFFGQSMQMLCLCLALSVCVCLFHFPPCSFFFSFLSPFLLLLSVLLTQTYQSNGQTDYAREKREQKKKDLFFHLDDIGRSHLSSSILASWLNVYPHCSVVYSTFSFQYSLLASFS